MSIKVCVGSDPVLTPEVATTYLGGSVTFTCTTSNPLMIIMWKTRINFEEISNKTIQIDNIKQNNTRVQCVTKYPNQHKHFSYSNKGWILLQGNIILLFSINQLFL